MNLAETINCPYCKGLAKLTQEAGSIIWRGNSYPITHYYYKCECSDDEFTTTESDTKTMLQIPGYEEYCNLRQAEGEGG